LYKNKQEENPAAVKRTGLCTIPCPTLEGGQDVVESREQDESQYCGGSEHPYQEK
jgi:hypothetical protein